MRIGLRPQPRRLFRHVVTPHLGPAEKESLLGAEPIDLRRLFASERIHQRHVGDAQPAVVGGVLAQRELAVQIDSGTGLYPLY